MQVHSVEINAQKTEVLIFWFSLFALLQNMTAASAWLMSISGFCNLKCPGYLTFQFVLIFRLALWLKLSINCNTVWAKVEKNACTSLSWLHCKEGLPAWSLVPQFAISSESHSYLIFPFLSPIISCYKQTLKGWLSSVLRIPRFIMLAPAEYILKVKIYFSLKQACISRCNLIHSI